MWFTQCSETTLHLFTDFKVLLEAAVAKGSVEVEIVKCVTLGPPEAGKTQLKSALMGRFDDSDESTAMSTAADIVMKRYIYGKTSWEPLTQEGLLRCLRTTVEEKHSSESVSATSLALAEEDVATLSVVDQKTQPQTNSPQTVTGAKFASGCGDEAKRKAALVKKFSTLRKSVEQGLTEADSTDVRSLQKLRMIHLIDSGGQPAFLDVHPVIASSSAIYFLVYNMEEGLEAKPRITYRKKSFPTKELPNKQKSNMDMIRESLLVLQHCKRKFAKMEEGLRQWFGQPIGQGENVPVLIVGTRGITHNIESESEKLVAGCGHLPTWNDVLDCNDTGKQLFAVDSKDQGCKGLQSVRDAIDEAECYYRLPLPIPWVLCQLIFWSSDREDLHVLKYADLQDICIQENLVASNAEFLAMIRTFHLLGIFSFPYFDQEEALCDQWRPDTHPVFTSPDVLYSHVTKILEVAFRNLKKTKMKPETKRRLKELQSNGQLDVSLLGHLDIQDHVGSFSGFRSYLLELLVQWGLAAKLGSADAAVNSTNDTSYFIPSVLPTNGQELSCLQPLHITFDLAFTFQSTLQNGMTFYHMPQGIFPHVVANILTTHRYYIIKTDTENYKCLFRDLAIFTIKSSSCSTMEHSYSVHLANNMDHISIMIQPSHAAMRWSAPDCHQIMRDFQLTIENVYRRIYLTHHDVTVACHCPCGRINKEHLATLTRNDQWCIRCLSIEGPDWEEYCPDNIATIMNQGMHLGLINSFPRMS